MKNLVKTAPTMLLEIKNLSVEYFRGNTLIPAVRNASIHLERGKSLGIVGESGSGKSTLALSLLRLIGRHEGRISNGELIFNGKNLLNFPENEIREIRGKDIGFVFQDPFTSLNPVLKIGEQIEEGISVHNQNWTAPTLKNKAIEWLSRVRLTDPERIYDAYPHQISGGQRQRALIAMAIANHPQILIADEPTTALDVTVQKEILDLLAGLKKELEMAILLITHHLGIVERYTENLAVMYAGEFVEQGETAQVLHHPQHPYTQGLLRSLPGKKRSNPIQGMPPELTHLPNGCVFHPRCPVAESDCKTKAPELKSIKGMRNRKVSCHLSPFPHS